MNYDDQMIADIKKAAEEYAGMDESGNCDIARLMSFEDGCMFMVMWYNNFVRSSRYNKKKNI